jgi:uncharacterized lipoprotein YehR (DUF1307 family)
MKNIKSLLAVVMVLVIGVCLTGCVTEKDKENSNAEFATWFQDITFMPDGIRVYFTDKAISELADFDINTEEGEELNFTTDDDGNKYLKNISIPDYVSTVFSKGDDGSKLSNSTVNYKVMIENSDNGDLAIKGMFINFRPDLGGFGNSNDIINDMRNEFGFDFTAGIDTVAITVKDNNGEEITITYYTQKKES